jgi:hypothetical protein
MVEEKFIFSSSAKKNIFILIAVGLVLTVLGLIFVANSSHGHEEGGEKGHAVATEANHGSDTHVSGIHNVTSHKDVSEAAEHGHKQKAIWYVRLIKNLWQNCIFFTGISLIAVFFIAFNYVAWAGWGVTIKRIPEAIGSFLPYIAVITLVIFFVFYKDIFHWSVATGDPIIQGKSGYLNMAFFSFRSIADFVLWILFWWFLRRYSLQEEITGDIKWYDKSVVLSGGFLVVFGITSSTSAWDWVMSIDAHFYSTMFGWYVFASWFITGLAVITLLVVYLKEAGYLKVVNENHIHDLGTYMFAFSIFWTYIWFAQFLIIYYANIPDEAVYFVERLKNDVYSPFFFFNFIVNFCFPFLILMSRDAKRHMIIIKIVGFAILIGHWVDFYLMITPSFLAHNGGFDFQFFFVELGVTLVFTGLFLYVVLNSLTKAALVPKHHPMLEESIHHHI